MNAVGVGTMTNGKKFHHQSQDLELTFSIKRELEGEEYTALVQVPNGHTIKIEVLFGTRLTKLDKNHADLEGFIDSVQISIKTLTGSVIPVTEDLRKFLLSTLVVELIEEWLKAFTNTKSARNVKQLKRILNVKELEWVVSYTITKKELQLFELS